MTTTARPVILCDSREQRPLIFSAAVDIERATLPAGDYSVKGSTGRVAIERKSLPDLVACCGRERERFLDCCRRLAGYDLRAVVVEASLADVEAKLYRGLMRPQSVIGTTIALLTDYGIPTIWAGTPEGAARIVERLLVRIHARQARGLEPVGAVLGRVLSDITPEEGPPSAA